MKTDKIIDEIQYLLRSIGVGLQKMRTNDAVEGVWQGMQLKSEADLWAERMLVNGLNLLTPGVHIVSEEDLRSHLMTRPSHYWIIDPIDGTASFCGGFLGYVTQVALIKAGRVILAGVYAPALDLMYLAEESGGATVNDRKLVVNQEGPNIALIDNYPKPHGIAKRLTEELPCSDYIESGSIGLKICRVADGKADLFVKDVIYRDWDVAPGNLVLKEAGGVLTDLRGFKIDYGGKYEKTHGIIAASSQKIVNRVIDVCAQFYL